MPSCPALRPACALLCPLLCPQYPAVTRCATLCHAASRCALLQTDAMFRVQHTDPWVRGDAHRTSRTTTIQVSASASQCRQCALSHTTHHRRPSEHHGRPFADADNSHVCVCCCCCRTTRPRLPTSTAGRLTTWRLQRAPPLGEPACLPSWLCLAALGGGS